jgi:hypothetical protein
MGPKLKKKQFARGPEIIIIFVTSLSLIFSSGKYKILEGKYEIVPRQKVRNFIYKCAEPAAGSQYEKYQRT